MAKRKPVRKAERHAPTPETAAKLEPDPVRVLVDSGKLSADAESAAAEICDIYTSVVRELMPGRMKFNSPVAGVDEISDRLAQLYRTRYMPWARRTAPPILNATITLCVDRMPMPNKLAEQFVIGALHDYADSS